MNSPGVEFEWGTRIPMRDGVMLNSTLYLPKGNRAPAPCAFMLSPYIADTHHERGMYFASHAIPFAIVESRGRGNSEGEFRPYIQEAEDGADVVEWLASQSYCNGRVAMCGASYVGYCQWATAKERPPHLVAIVPTTAPYVGVDFPMRNNIFNPFVVQWLTLVSGRTAQTSVFADVQMWAGLFKQWHISGRPFREFDAMAGVPTPIFQEWLAHPAPDAYWDRYNPTEEQYARIDIPILTITGCYDDDQPGALEHYKQHMRYGSAQARERHFLVIGPWDHAGSSWTSRAEFGGIACSQSCLIDKPKLHLEWYRWTMGTGPRPSFLQKPVSYYVMGAERWKYADSLADITARHDIYYLDSNGTANDVFASGSLSPLLAQGPPDTYTYDPQRADGPEIEAEASLPIGSIVDQTVPMALSGRQLVYHSAPFVEDTEISGFFRFCAWVSIDCPDTDFYVTVFEIGNDGESIRLSTDGMRARYREDRRIPRLIDTTDPLLYDFHRFTFISRQIKRGHRLRLIIAPVGRLVDTIFSEKNFNGGGVVAAECADHSRVVTVRVLHDHAHPSALHVPIGRPDGSEELSAAEAAYISVP
jgi:uncharacterized protein